MCFSLSLICYQLAHQADHTKEFQAQQVQLEELRRQLEDKTLQKASLVLIAGPSPSATPSDP